MTTRQEKASRKKELAEEIRDACKAGTLAPGSLLPSVRELALRHGLSKRVVNEELQKLVEEGWLRSVPRVGIFVKEAASADRHFLHHSVVLLASGNGQPPVDQKRPGWMSHISVGAIREIEEHGLHALILNPGRLCGEVIDRLVLERPMGIVVPEIVNLEAFREHAQQLKNNGIPVVLNTGDPAFSSFDRVTSDAEQGGYLLGKWLLERGRKHLRQVWLHGLDEYWAQDRRSGFERALREAGLNPPPTLEVPDVTATLPLDPADIERVAAILRPWLQQRPKLDGILAASDGPAAILDHACRYLGFLPGQDLDITGYDNYWQDLEACGYASAKPTATVDRNNQQIGAELVRALLQRAEEAAGGHHDPAPLLRKVPVQLLET